MGGDRRLLLEWFMLSKVYKFELVESIAII